MPKLLYGNTKSAIINIGNLNHSLYQPNWVLYSASSGFMKIFSKCLQKDYWNQLDVMFVSPGEVNDFSKSIFGITRKWFVSATLDKIGRNS